MKNIGLRVEISLFCRAEGCNQHNWWSSTEGEGQAWDLVIASDWVGNRSEGFYCPAHRSLGEKLDHKEELE